ncbi:MAG: 16S rRNA (cytidine(1402)-2'-O)-methyltransferase [Candidatus Woesearchaeota archaeon]
MLFIVATPIGNLKDITLRALETLKTVDIIAAEDTRRTGILLSHYNIVCDMVSYNEHNKKKRTPFLISKMKDGKKVALVSDAGTPGISDPGYHLICAAISEGIRVVPLPGPCAAVTALVCSGLQTSSYSFYGFLPKKEHQKKKLFRSLSMETAATKTLIFYESPHRIHKTLRLLCDVLPKKNLCVARELTKKFEEFIRGTPGEVISKIGNKKLKGEIVLLIGEV